jgi:hypothetical protein
MTNSTISDNSSDHGDGGGIFNSGGTLTMTNSTASGNSASTKGGGILIQTITDQQSPIAQANFTFSTIYDNRATEGADIAVKDGTYSYDSQNGTPTFEPSKQISQVQIRNSIVGGNDAQHNPIAAVITSEGYNVIQHMSAENFDSSTAHATDRSVDDLTGVLGSHPQLQNNGGATQTYQLISGEGNAALDKVPPEACTDSTGQRVVTDQRGMPRPGKNKQWCDSGAYESQR